MCDCKAQFFLTIPPMKRVDIDVETIDEFIYRKDELSILQQFEWASVSKGIEKLRDAIEPYQYGIWKVL